MNDYKIILEWAYYDGLQAGICEKDGIRYIFSMKNWANLYPEDEQGNELPRTYDLYPYDTEAFATMPEYYMGWDDWFDKYLLNHDVVGECKENEFARRRVDG